MSRLRAGSRVLVVNNASFSQEDQKLFIAPATGRFLVELAGLGVAVRAAQVAARYGPSDRRSDFDLRDRPGVELTTLPWRLDTPGKLRVYLRALPWALREVRAADFVYAFLPGHVPLLFVAACRLLRRPYGLMLRGEVGRLRLAFALAGARFVLTTSARLREIAARAGVDAEMVTPMLDVGPEDVVEGRGPRAPGPWRLLFVGRVETAKGVAELLDAVELLGSRGLPVELDLAGWALEFEQHRADARRRGLANVTFHGAVASRERLRELYDRADLFVLPTHHEGFPRVLYEAMARRLPIVTTFVGGIPARMRDRVNCVRAPERDAAGLADAIETVLRDPALGDAIARGGAATIREFFSGERPSHARQLWSRIGPGPTGDPEVPAPEAGSGTAESDASSARSQRP